MFVVYNDKYFYLFHYIVNDSTVRFFTFRPDVVPNREKFLAISIHVFQPGILLLFHILTTDYYCGGLTVINSK